MIEPTASPHTTSRTFTLWALALGAFSAAALFLVVLLFAEYGSAGIGVLMGWLLERLLKDRYAAIFAVAFIAAFGLPIPAGAMLMASAFYATQGVFSLPLVVLVGTVASVGGDLAGYGLSRLYGAEFFRGIGLGWLLRAPEIGRLERLTDEHPAAAVFVTRFMTTVAPASNVIIGLAKVPFRTFLLFDALGQLGEVGLNVAIGAVFGSRWESLYKVFGRTGVAFGAVAVVAAIVYFRRIRRRHARGAGNDAGTQGGPAVRV